MLSGTISYSWSNPSLCFNSLIVSHEKVPAALCRDQAKHKYEKEIFFSQMRHTMAAPTRN